MLVLYVFACSIRSDGLQILATAHLKIFACPFDKEPIKQLGRTPIYTGQPVTATVSIHTSFQWAGRERKGSLSYRIHYELEENIKDWLLSGQKRGDFMAKVPLLNIVLETYTNIIKRMTPRILFPSH